MRRKKTYHYVVYFTPTRNYKNNRSEQRLSVPFSWWSPRTRVAWWEISDSLVGVPVDFWWTPSFVIMRFPRNLFHDRFRRIGAGYEVLAIGF